MDPSGSCPFEGVPSCCLPYGLLSEGKPCCSRSCGLNPGGGACCCCVSGFSSCGGICCRAFGFTSCGEVCCGAPGSGRGAGAPSRSVAGDCPSAAPGILFPDGGEGKLPARFPSSLIWLLVQVADSYRESSHTILQEMKYPHLMLSQPN